MVSAREDSSIAGVADWSWRCAELRDASILLQWRNDPTTVRYSKSGALVSRDEHARWFEAVLRDKVKEILVSEANGIPIATCRFESGNLTPDAFLVSINVAPKLRGYGIGEQLLTSAISHFFSRHSSDLLADIHKDNIASERIFTRAGFRWVGSDGDFNRFLLQAVSGDAS